MGTLIIMIGVYFASESIPQYQYEDIHQDYEYTKEWLAEQPPEVVDEYEE